MSKYRKNLPQLNGGIFLTDGGLETTLVFLEEIDLPHFAAFDLLKDEEGLEVLRRYYERYASIARSAGTGFVLEAPTWRASPDWGALLGYDELSLADANRRAIGLMLELRERFETPDAPFVISGNVGPRGDGYQPGEQMTAEASRQYHAAQIDTFAQTDADFVSAFTINYVDEAIGIVEAARRADIPVVVSFTVETDGRLPTGETLASAIRRTDDATNAYGAYYMINCAHPAHFDETLEPGSEWVQRIRGLRANASLRSHAELDESPDLDIGDPEDLARRYSALRSGLPGLGVLGGCCGTDHRHIEAICQACVDSTEKRRQEHERRSVL